MATNEFTLDDHVEPLKAGWQLWLGVYILGFGSLVILLMWWSAP